MKICENQEYPEVKLEPVGNRYPTGLFIYRLFDYCFVCQSDRRGEKRGCIYARFKISEKAKVETCVLCRACVADKSPYQIVEMIEAAIMGYRQGNEAGVDLTGEPL